MKTKIAPRHLPGRKRGNEKRVAIFVTHEQLRKIREEGCKEKYNPHSSID